MLRKIDFLDQRQKKRSAVAGVAGQEGAEDLEEAGVGVALVEEDGALELDGQLELRREPAVLRRARRVVAVVVEAALADGDDLLRIRGGELAQRRDGGAVA